MSNTNNTTNGLNQTFELNQPYQMSFVMRFDAMVVISPLRDSGDNNEAGKAFEQWQRGGGLHDLIVTSNEVGEYTFYFGNDIYPETKWRIHKDESDPDDIGVRVPDGQTEPKDHWFAVDDYAGFSEAPYYQISLTRVTSELV